MHAILQLWQETLSSTSDNISNLVIQEEAAIMRCSFKKIF